jgi:hypothetical protein
MADEAAEAGRVGFWEGDCDRTNLAVFFFFGAGNEMGNWWASAPWTSAFFRGLFFFNLGHLQQSIFCLVYFLTLLLLINKQLHPI